MEYEDKYIECVDCGVEFVHSADDQARFEARGLLNDPKRCPSCREAKRGRRRGGPGGGGPGGGRPRPDRPAPRERTAEPDSRVSPEPPARIERPAPAQAEPASEPKPNAGPQPDAGPEPDAEPQRTEFEWPDPKKYNYPITCAECGQEASVPFKPTADSPVYCTDCFVSKLPR